MIHNKCQQDLFDFCTDYQVSQPLTNGLKRAFLQRLINHAWFTLYPSERESRNRLLEILTTWESTQGGCDLLASNQWFLIDVRRIAGIKPPAEVRVVLDLHIDGDYSPHDLTTTAAWIERMFGSQPNATALPGAPAGKSKLCPVRSVKVVDIR